MIVCWSATRPGLVSVSAAPRMHEARRAGHAGAVELLAAHVALAT
jgi:hypothetical protein